MSWVDLLKTLDAFQNRTTAVIDLHWNSALESFRTLEGTLFAQEHRSRDSSERRVAEIDLNLLKGKVADHKWSELSARENRVVPHLFLEFPPPLIRDFLEAFPNRWNQFLRALLRKWSLDASSLTWNRYAELASYAPADAWPIGELPVLHRILVTKEGPHLIALECKDAALQEFADKLLRAGVHPWTELFGACLTALFAIKDRSECDVSGDVSWLLQTPAMQGVVLPPRRASDQGRVGSESIYALSVASLLSCRLKKLVNESECQRLEEHLLECIFGDPRIGGGSWDRVREHNSAAFEVFLENLIRDDLKFFFDHAMRQADRARFWLSYLKSIRRTQCILDPTSYSRLKTKVAAADRDRDLRAALQRARRFEGGETSAFCLWFDRFVVVEFSNVGNAAYVYNRDAFQKEVDAPGKRLWDVTSFKKTNLVVARWIHQRGWELKIREELRAKGIRP